MSACSAGSRMGCNAFEVSRSICKNSSHDELLLQNGQGFVIRSGVSPHQAVSTVTLKFVVCLRAWWEDHTHIIYDSWCNRNDDKTPSRSRCRRSRSSQRYSCHLVILSDRWSCIKYFCDGLQLGRTGSMSVDPSLVAKISQSSQSGLIGWVTANSYCHSDSFDLRVECVLAIHHGDGRAGSSGGRGEAMPPLPIHR